MDAVIKDKAATTHRKALSWKRLGPPCLDQPTPEVRLLGFSARGASQFHSVASPGGAEVSLTQR